MYTTNLTLPDHSNIRFASTFYREIPPILVKKLKRNGWVDYSNTIDICI